MEVIGTNLGVLEGRLPIGHPLLAPRVGRRRPDTVYVVRCRDFYKIGITSNLRERLHTIQVGCPFDVTLEVSFTPEDPQATEEALHQRFSEYHHRGEWYRLPDEALAHIKNTATGIEDTPNQGRPRTWISTWERVSDLDP